MSPVKGSKQYSMKVVAHRPARRFMLVLVLLVLVGGAIAAAYYGGYWQGMGTQAQALEDRARLQKALAQAREETESLRQQVANLSLSSEVDQMASEEVRTEVMGLREKIASLEADISFYRSLMAPSEDNSGLTIGEVNIVETSVPGRYSFNILVQQLATNHQLLNGELTVDVVGRREGAPARLPLHQLSDDIDGEAIKLRFKYFQNIAGELSLPDGFEAQKLELAARTSGRNADSAEKSYGWLVEDR